MDVFVRLLKAKTVKPVDAVLSMPGLGTQRGAHCAHAHAGN
jgi:hypothetical protein